MKKKNFELQFIFSTSTLTVLKYFYSANDSYNITEFMTTKSLSDLILFSFIQRVFRLTRTQIIILHCNFGHSEERKDIKNNNYDNSNHDNNNTSIYNINNMKR